MANIKSAKKRIKVIDRQRTENRLVKTTIATYTKKFRALVASGELAQAEAKLKETISLIDSAESKGILHKNNASRKVARLSQLLAKAQAEVKPAAKEEVKVEVKAEPAQEEKPAKKPAAKKATTKKAEAEEKPAKKTTKKAAKVSE